MYMWEPHELHWKVAKRIVRYVQGNIIYGFLYASVFALDFIGFTDSDWAGDNIDRKSTFEYTISLGGGPSLGRAKKGNKKGDKEKFFKKSIYPREESFSSDEDDDNDSYSEGVLSMELKNDKGD
jgi:hypothetical protein